MDSNNSPAWPRFSLNGDGVRSCLGSAGDTGAVGVLDALPFEDHNALATVSGSLLRKILEQRFSLERGLLQVSGIVVSYEPTAKKGSRVQDVCVNGKVLEAKQLCTIATLEILAQGGDAYGLFLEAKEVQVFSENYAETLESAFTHSGVHSNLRT
ncbi:MAG: 5'-nucleotidase C-terminal domain-containing protein [Congregibacter sp.]